MTQATIANGQETAFHGRDELNLIDFPIAVLQYQQPKVAGGKAPDELVCEIVGFDSDLGKVVPRKLTRRTASKYGFPTPLEDEVLIGLLTLTRQKNGFSSPRVTFQPSELFALMGWPPNGTSVKRLSVALDRLTGLTLKYENAWTTEDGTVEKEFTTGLLESNKLFKQPRGRSTRPLPDSYIQWASEVFSDIQQGNVRELNTDEFFSLGLPLSRRMYRFLDKQFSDNSHFEMDLSTFAQYLGLSETSHIGKIKHRLRPAIEELENLPGFLEALAPKDRFRKQGPGSWMVVFDRAAADKPRESPLPPREKQPPRESSDTATGLVKDFYESWNGNVDHTSTSKERTQAQSIIDTYGGEAAQKLLPFVIKTMKTEFPDARSFGATMHFWVDAAKTAEKKKAVVRKETAEKKRERESEQRLETSEKERQVQREQWDNLPESEKESIRNAVSQNASRTVRQFLEQKKYDDFLVMLECFNEMKRRSKCPSS